MANDERYKTADVKVFGLAVCPQTKFSEFGIDFTCEDEKLLNRITTTQAIDLDPYVDPTQASVAKIVHTQELIKGMLENGANGAFGIGRYFGVRLCNSENSSDIAIQKRLEYHRKIWETSRFVAVHKGICFVCMNVCNAYYPQTYIVFNLGFANFLDHRVANFRCYNTPRKHGCYIGIYREDGGPKILQTLELEIMEVCG